LHLFRPKTKNKNNPQAGDVDLKNTVFLIWGHTHRVPDMEVQNCTYPPVRNTLII